MKKADSIIIICHNVIKGGGPPIVSDFLNYTLAKNVNVVLLCPKSNIYKQMVKQAKIRHVNGALTVRWFPESLNSIWFKPIINYLYLPVFTLFAKGNRIYNLGNVAFPAKKRQFLLMHNAFAVVTDEELYKRFPIAPRFKQKLMNYFIRVNLKFADVIAVQTQTIKKKIDAITNREAVIIANISNDRPFFFSSYRLLSNNDIKLLFLSKYYTHKNFEILIPLAKLIIQHNLPYTISITFDKANKEESSFLELIYNQNLTAVIKNIGYISPDNIANTYHEHDALLLPTLMESFSGTYTEAMSFGKPIFTSDRDFAREVCEECAIYFDPLNVNDIIDKLNTAFHNLLNISKMVNASQEKLKNILKEKECMSKLILISLQVGALH